MSIFQELKRRNVFRVAIIYVFASWLIVQVVATIFPAFGYDAAAVRIAVIVQGIGFIPAMILTWVFEITPDGIKKEKDVDRSRPPISEISLEILEALSHRQYFGTSSSRNLETSGLRHGQRYTEHQQEVFPLILSRLLLPVLLQAANTRMFLRLSCRHKQAKWTEQSVFPIVRRYSFRCADT